jgi:hypothetical protein
MNFRIRAFLQWIVKSGGKPNTPVFKSQRDAAEFVRRAYNQSRGPNPKLLKMYKNYDEARREQESSQDQHRAA